MCAWRVIWFAFSPSETCTLLPLRAEVVAFRNRSRVQLVLVFMLYHVFKPALFGCSSRSCRHVSIRSSDNDCVMCNNMWHLLTFSEIYYVRFSERNYGAIVSRLFFPSRHSRSGMALPGLHVRGGTYYVKRIHATRSKVATGFIRLSSTLPTARAQSRTPPCRILRPWNLCCERIDTRLSRSFGGSVG